MADSMVYIYNIFKVHTVCLIEIMTLVRVYNLSSLDNMLDNITLTAKLVDKMLPPMKTRTPQYKQPFTNMYSTLSSHTQRTQYSRSKVYTLHTDRQTYVK